jgi:uncharacterized membrane protein
MAEPILILNPRWETVLSSIHVLGWSIYVGGAICMEVVLRYAQNYMKPSQVAIVCQQSGKRYRWWSFVCLMLLFATGMPMAMTSSAVFDPSSFYGRVILVLFSLWILQLALLAVLTFIIHPDMHTRVLASMSAAQIKEERARVGIAITRMDHTVRIELTCAIFALLAGSMLHLDSLILPGS